MSDTPRTDGQEDMHYWPSHASRFARQLERELNAALKEIQGLKNELENTNMELRGASRTIDNLMSEAHAHMAVCGKEAK